MNRLRACVSLVLALGLLGLPGCHREVICADEPENRFCYVADAGPDGGGQLDAGDGDADADAGPPDAGPCDGACDADHCVDGACVDCTEATQAEDCGDEGFCVEGACVQCRTGIDCNDSTTGPACVDGMCAPCTADPQCAERTDAPVCASGACVQCTAANRSLCGDNVCDGSTNTCTTRPAGGRGLCQDCIADAECMPGQLCVPMTFGGADVGSFCLWRQDASEGPGGACINVPPYAATTPAESIDGVGATVCSLALTTCEALNQFRMRSCTVGTPATLATDEECGVADIDDGLCRVRDVGVNRCTIPCLSDDDCLSGSTCNIAATPRYCNF